MNAKQEARFELDMTLCLAERFDAAETCRVRGMNIADRMVNIRAAVQLRAMWKEMSNEYCVMLRGMLRA